MTGRDGAPQSPLWIEAASGWLVHDPGAMNWGPTRACPVGIAVAPSDDSDPRRRRGVEVTVHIVPNGGVASDSVLLNPGAARWLGNRLIEAALLSENRQRFAALATPDQDPA